MAAPAIDAATFRALQDAAGAEFVSELVGTFLEEAPAMLAELEGALGARDAEKFRRVAHSLKSNCHTFGAMGLGALARELELGGLDRALQSGADPLAALKREYSVAAVALKGLADA